MNINEACKLLGFENITQLDKELISKNYKQLAKKYHPDIQRTEDDKNRCEQLFKDINDARETLLNVVDSIEARRRLEKQQNRPIIFAVIPFMELVNIYNGGSVTLRSVENTNDENNTVIINKSNVRINRIMLLINIEIEGNNGAKQIYSSTVPVTYNDEYTIDCDFYMTEGEFINGTHIKMLVNGEIKEYDLTSNKRVRMSYDNNVKLIININRKITVEHKED